MPAGVHRTPADGMTILGLPGKIGNANTNLHRNVEVFLFVEQQPPLCYNLFYKLEFVYLIKTNFSIIRGEQNVQY